MKIFHTNGASHDALYGIPGGDHVRKVHSAPVPRLSGREPAPKHVYRAFTWFCRREARLIPLLKMLGNSHDNMRLMTLWDMASGSKRVADFPFDQVPTESHAHMSYKAYSYIQCLAGFV